MIMSNDTGIRKAEKMGTCLKAGRGGTCMRRLRKKKFTEFDANGDKVSGRRPECPRHGRDIFSPITDGR
jgi:hypothetical protein